MCDEPQCINNGTCVNLPNGRFTCMCPPKFTGVYCEYEQKACLSDPCLNGGLCIEKQDPLDFGYTCQCSLGCEGARCEFVADVCKSNPCKSGACVQNGTYSYTCKCPPGI